MSDYQRIEKAINFILENRNKQPSLEEIAESVHLSPFHFQRLFSEWAGITPKRFLQNLTVEHAKTLLDQAKPLLQASTEAGLSGTSRLHDHFVSLEAVTPGEYKTAGQGLTIHYGIQETLFGTTFIATTERGICKIAFLNNKNYVDAVNALKQDWPLTILIEDTESISETASSIFSKAPNKNKPLSLYVRGTNFQVMVWRALLQIPQGHLQSYSSVATAIGKPKALRAVGTAIGANPIAFVIPCHRVIQQSGGIGGYRWGVARKYALQTWEANK